MIEALPAFDAPAPGLYRHYKGGWYEMVGTARCSETLQGMALYRPLYGNGLTSATPNASLWVRPAAMFLESGTFAGSHQARFAAWNVADVELVDVSAARAVVAYLQCAAKRQPIASLRASPPEPTDCCERGCNGCVWEGFYTAVDAWRSDALAALTLKP